MVHLHYIPGMVFLMSLKITGGGFLSVSFLLLITIATSRNTIMAQRETIATEFLLNFIYKMTIKNYRFLIHSNRWLYEVTVSSSFMNG